MEDDWPIDEKAAEDAELKAWLVAGGEGGMGVIGAVNHRVAGINTIPTGDPATEVLCARALEHLARTLAQVTRMLRLTAAARIRLREGTLGQVTGRAKAEPKPEWSQEDHERYEAAAYQTLQARIHRKGADQVMAEVIAETTEDLFERRSWSSAFYERLNDYEEEDLASLTTREIVEEICETLGLTPAADIWTRESRQREAAELEAFLERGKQPHAKYDAWIAKMTGKPLRNAGGP